MAEYFNIYPLLTVDVTFQYYHWEQEFVNIPQLWLVLCTYIEQCSCNAVIVKLKLNKHLHTVNY